MFVRVDLGKEQIRNRFGTFSDDGWSSHTRTPYEDAEDQDENTRATDDHVQSARSGTDTRDNPTIFAGSTIPSASGRNLGMSSKIKLDKFKGDGTQDVNAWFESFCQWAKFHDLADDKALDAFPFYLEGHAKIWYETLSQQQKSNSLMFKPLFFERFKELEIFLDLSVLQMKQKGTEPVIDFLSRLIKTASIKNVPEKDLLSVAMNGLKSEIKALVVTQNPKTMEQLRQIAILAEKSQANQVIALETYENLLTEIKSNKDQMVKKSEVNQMTQGQQYAQPYMPQQYSESWQYVQQPPVQRAPIFGERASQRVRFYEPHGRSRRPNPRFTKG